MNRSLYMCSHAKTWPVRCDKGQPLPRNATLKAVERGDPLFCKICQTCLFFSYMGEHPEERGWYGRI